MPNAIVTGVTENIKHQHLDLQASSKEIAKELSHIDTEVVCFTAYVAEDNEMHATRVNGDMLQNFLEALQIAGIIKEINRVIFHYRMQEVIGIAEGNFMNPANTLGIYAAANKEMGISFIFPDTPNSYTMFDSLTPANLHAKFNLWAVDRLEASNQCFNVVNGDAESWQNLWPKLGIKFGLKFPEQMFTPADFVRNFGEDGLLIPLMDDPPLTDYAADCGLKNGPIVKQSFVEGKTDVTKWAQRSEVKAAWKQLAEREQLDHDALDNTTWVFRNFVLCRNYSLVVGVSKASKLG